MCDQFIFSFSLYDARSEKRDFRLEAIETFGQLDVVLENNTWHETGRKKMVLSYKEISSKQVSV